MGTRISDYRYDLPPDRIALFPLSKRDDSKLLVYRKGQITHSKFHSVTDFLPANSFLFFNDTKVIPARIHFTKETGATIEIFLLSAVKPSVIISEVMAERSECVWQCTIGNLKRWTSPTISKEVKDNNFTAELIDRENGLVKFSWTGNLSFAEMVDEAGVTPLPPYLKRNAETSDKQRYQTIYSHNEGAVAAPTAGLHFTDEVFKNLASKNIQHDFLTLHVSAGTFQPVKTETAEDHVMHHEQIIVTKKNLENLLVRDRFIIPVGTTAMRTLESIYWYGVKLLKDGNASFEIGQEDPYNMNETPDAIAAISKVLEVMETQQTDKLIGETSIFIRPGYGFKICKGLITNFHQPGSTLMLLVAALIGKDWKRVYDEALGNEYRFLSYGDSSLLLP